MNAGKNRLKAVGMKSKKSKPDIKPAKVLCHMLMPLPNELC